MMPAEFSRKELVNIGKTLNLSIRTTDTYLREFIASQQVKNIAYGTFRKLDTQELSAWYKKNKLSHMDSTYFLFSHI